MLNELSEQLSNLNDPENEMMIEEPKESKKREKPAADLIKGMEEFEGKKFSLKKSKKIIKD